MNLTPQVLARDVAATGFGAEPFEKVSALPPTHCVRGSTLSGSRDS